MRSSLTIALLAGALMLGGCVETRPFNGVELIPPEPAPALQLPTAQGDTFDMQEQADHVVLVFFGFTHCPDVCPTTLSDWSRARAALGSDAEKVRWVFVSVDPERDTPEVADEYAKRFDPSFVGLSADTESIARIQKAFNITAWREPAIDDSPYSIAHSSQTFLVDRKGQLRLLYPFGFTSQELTEDLQRLVR